MLTDDETQQVRALLAQQDEVRRLLDGPRLSAAEATWLRQIVPQQHKLQALLRDARTVGAPSLLRRLFVQVADGTETVAAGAEADVTEIDVVPVNANADLAHRFYLLSCYDTAKDADPVAQNATVVGWMTTVAVFDAPGVHTALWKYRATSGDDRLIVNLRIVNATAEEIDLAYRVYRVAGLT